LAAFCRSFEILQLATMALFEPATNHFCHHRDPDDCRFGRYKYGVEIAFDAASDAINRRKHGMSLLVAGLMDLDSHRFPEPRARLRRRLSRA
jgi:hypothetical protein